MASSISEQDVKMVEEWLELKTFFQQFKVFFNYYLFLFVFFYQSRILSSQSYRGDHGFDAELCWLVGTFASLAHTGRLMKKN